MNENGLTPYGRNNTFPVSSTGYPVVDAAINTIMLPFYRKKWIEAQTRLAEEMMKAKTAERKAILSTLKDIALSTNDDQLKYQMFQGIYMMSATWN